VRVIHLCRKPLREGSVAANILKHGTGGLNIGASRIAGVTKHNLSNGVFKHSGGGQHQDQFVKANYRGDVERTDGRWPSNVILQHLPGCRCEGVRTVASDGHFPASRGQGSQVSGPAGHQGQDGLEERYTKGELVAAWSCESGCPVADIDGQTGVLKTTWVASSHSNNRGGEFLGGMGHPGNQGYNDTGGASRFFKQVGGKDE
jgi:hypothetical protein